MIMRLPLRSTARGNPTSFFPKGGRNSPGLGAPAAMRAVSVSRIFLIVESRRAEDHSLVMEAVIADLISGGDYPAHELWLDHSADQEERAPRMVAAEKWQDGV